MLQLVVENSLWKTLLPRPTLWAKKILSTATTHLNLTPQDCTVLLSDDATLHDLNNRFLGKDKPTNVLSFPSTSPGYWGDIALAWETCQREATEQNKDLYNHASHLLLHGFLHLLGYDHETEPEAHIMESLEITILSCLKMPNPYEQ